MILTQTVDCPKNRWRVQRYAGSSKELHTIPTPLPDVEDASREDHALAYDQSADGYQLINLNKFDSTEGRYNCRTSESRQMEDRRMPFLNLRHAENNFLSVEGCDVDGTAQDVLDYMGEVIVRQ